MVQQSARRIERQGFVESIHLYIHTILEISESGTQILLISDTRSKKDTLDCLSSSEVLQLLQIAETKDSSRCLFSAVVPEIINNY